MALSAQKSQWDKLARIDPLWAILTRRSRRGGGWKPEEFFATGEQQINDVIARAARLGLPALRSEALDFGCGVGRLTQALAAHFDRVTGVDIAPRMIEEAQRYNRYGDRCVYVLNEEDGLRIFPDASFDLVCSLITLQHLPPRHVRSYLREFIRVLRPDGLLVFQLPAGYRSLRVKLVSGIYQFVTRRLFRAVSIMDMYGIRRERVEGLLREYGARVLAVEEDTMAGECWLGYRYFATRGKPGTVHSNTFSSGNR